MLYRVSVICCFVFIFHAYYALADDYCDNVRSDYSASSHNYCGAVNIFFEYFNSIVESHRDSNWNIEKMKLKYENIFGSIVFERYAGRAEQTNSYCPKRAIREVYYAKGAKIVFWDSLDERCAGTDLDSIEYTGQEAILPLGIEIGDNKTKITKIFGRGCDHEQLCDKYPEMCAYYPEIGQGVRIMMVGCDANEILCFFKENRLVKIIWYKNS